MLLKLLQLQNCSISSFLNNYKNTLLVLPIVVGIQACGGGGGSSDNTTPTVPKSYAFSLTSTLTNKCGEKLPFVDVELFIQNNDWSVVTKLQPNANGLFSFSSENELINYTLVAKTQQVGKVEGLDFVSFHQVKATTPATYQAEHISKVVDTNCECITQNVEVSHTPVADITQVTSSATFASTAVINSERTDFINVEVCRIIDGTWPLHSFSLVGTGNNSNVQGAAGFIDDFNQTVINSDNQVVWQLSAFTAIEQIGLNKNHQPFTTQQLFLGQTHFAMTVLEEDNAVDLFNSHLYVSETVYQSNAEVIFSETDSAFGKIKISSQHQVISSAFNTSFAVAATTKKPDVDDIYFSEIKSDWSYDYSNVANYPLAIITVNYQAYHPEKNTPMPAKWTSYGKITGQLPVASALSGYEGIINDDTIVLGTNTDLVQSEYTDKYANYLVYYQNESNGSFTDNVKNYHISIKK
ncbi:hypothetical protein [Colwellia hornerae]|uniref:Uncharacterized protein n=1 Tax=Colwellia hornerae TaxID=89402 RepID=A0A5C6QP96_9GAMM|nr:hypothetical protein [Colwellia hornerae]TWX56344.1 hypothetical protein ESZ28_05510 [Colwellia hornerae]TWX62195.1 hypothetical protein ESZ26_04285 [Colwellia hornerae]TWX70597.1 hypothetical protein ESZ27_03540 [Colwellia hornerae]